MARLDLIESNWDSFWNTSETAEQLAPYQSGWFYSIDDLSCNILCESNILAVSCSSTTAKPSQRYAGKIKQIIRTGLTVGGQPDTVNAARSIWLNQISLIMFPNATDYHVIISPYWKLRDITITAWAYTGPIVNQYDEILNTIKTAVLNV